MADIQTRLREAMRAEAEQASPQRLRPLRPLPERTARRRARTRGWLVPAAAAMAIVAVIALVTTGVHVATARPSRTVAPVVSKPPWPVGGTGRPAYFAEFGVVPNSRGWDKKSTSVMIHSSVTGDTLSTVSLPATNRYAGGYGGVITAAGDDRHFLVEFPTGTQTHTVWRFWWLVVAPNGRRVTVSPLRIPAGPAGMVISSIALTADGTKLAVGWGGGTTYNLAPAITAELEVINLVTGSTQSWSTRRDNIRFVPGMIGSLSWGTGDMLLGFVWEGPWYNQPDRGYYLLDTADPGAGLLSREVIPGFSGGRTLGSAYLAGPAQSVIASVTLPVRGKPKIQSDGAPAIVEFSVRTGQIVRTLYGPAPFSYGMQYEVKSVDPSGQHVLISTPTLARIDNGLVTPLPGLELIGISALAAW